MKVIQELKAMDDARFQALYEDLAQNGFGPLDAEVAQLLRFRPQAIRKLPMAQRARKARQLMISRANAELCYEFFGSWLIKERKGVVTGFLDGTGVTHEDGMIEDLEHNKPDAGKLADTIKTLDAEFPPEDVTLYLSLAAEQWPAVDELDALWRARSAAAATPS
jgi:hypothetical protein